LAVAFDATLHVPEIGLWKVSGDGIIFSAAPRNAAEADRIVEPFAGAIASSDQRLDRKFGLRVRGCCWAARFPGSNIEVEIPEMATSGPREREHYLEYIGPDIDAGFRIAKFARRGRLLVSLNLARAIAGLEDQGNAVFRLLDREGLKGMFEGEGFPLIEVSFGDDRDDCAAAVTGREILQLADAFEASQPGGIEPLFDLEA
jgi:hypothetical protein